MKSGRPILLPYRIAQQRLPCALSERDAAAARDALRRIPAREEAVNFTRPFVEGVIARMTNDEHEAQLAFTAARAEQENRQSSANYGPALCARVMMPLSGGRTEPCAKDDAVDCFRKRTQSMVR